MYVIVKSICCHGNDTKKNILVTTYLLLLREHVRVYELNKNR